MFNLQMIYKVLDNPKATIEEMLEVSNKLHEFEVRGGCLSTKEERLWERLTDRIETKKKTK